MAECTCVPCTSPGYGAIGFEHCAACCYGELIEQYDHYCPIPEHRDMANLQFGERPTMTDDDVRRAAELCHEANRLYCESLGDYTQVRWHEAAPWQREAAMKGVKVALSGASSAEQHEAWLKDKEADGWTYGETKDPVKKTHPCMVPYNQLPKSQQRKDGLFIACVRAMEWATLPE